MPIEIRELVIKAEVGHRDGGQRTGNESSSSMQHSQQDEQLIKTCVERVLEIIKEKSER